MGIDKEAQKTRRSYWIKRVPFRINLNIIIRERDIFSASNRRMQLWKLPTIELFKIIMYSLQLWKWYLQIITKPSPILIHPKIIIHFLSLHTSPHVPELRIMWLLFQCCKFCTTFYIKRSKLVQNTFCERNHVYDIGESHTI